MYILVAILIFAILIFVHELGHFMAARAGGIGVREFAIGMGPKILKRQKGETLYSLRVLPIGGFCAMVGEDEDSEDPKAFTNRPIPARIITLFAGSLMNILLAIVLVSMLIFSFGEPTTTLDEVEETSSAAALGLAPGDTILAINGQKVKKWEDVSNIILEINEDLPADGAAPTATVLYKNAAGEQKTIEVTLYKPTEDDYYKIGITSRYGKSVGLFFRSFGYGTQSCLNMMKMMYSTIGQLFTGKASVNELTGPVGIVKAVEESQKEGLIYVIQLAALISLNLGIVNLLPLPALDGGRIVFQIIRIFTGKRVSDELEGKIHLVGIVLLFALMIYITVIDVDRFILN
ncbi:MAG: RIP metalloprotease RseP [Clostridiales Family XIII bacterium]|jgi:regulator of sigma E protease|nr:RIP metalloprotease RseP [Clostridiales Family XIII bacterium]